MKYLVATNNPEGLLEVDYLRCIYDITSNQIYVQDNITPPLDNPVTVFIDGSELILDGDKTLVDNGYNDLYSQSSYTDYYTSSSADYSIDTNNTNPVEGDIYYTTCDYEPTLIIVIIDGNPTEADTNRAWSDQEYSSMYVLGGMIDCLSEQPIPDTKYSTDSISIYIDGNDTSVSSYYPFNEQSYDTIYYVTTSTSNWENWSSNTPNENDKYSTSYVTVSVDNASQDLSPSYKFSEQDYGSMYNVNDSMYECTDDYPNNGGKYSQERTTVQINGDDINMSSYYTFADQGYDTMYTISEFPMVAIECSTDVPTENSQYSTSNLVVMMDSEEIEMSPCYTFEAQIKNSEINIYYLDDKTWTECNSSNPTSENRYTSTIINVTIDGEETVVSSNYLFNYQGYETMYNVEDSMNNCLESNPQENGKYSQYSITIYIDGTSTTASPYYTFAEQNHSEVAGYIGSGWTPIDVLLDKPTEGMSYYTSEPSE